MIPARLGMDAGLIVRDMEPMIAFYTEAIGLTQVGERTTGWGRMVEFGFGETVLRLLRPVEEPATHKAPMLGATGVRYLTFPVLDFDECLARAIAWGAPQTIETIRAGTARFAMVGDPEGNVVEFIGWDS